MSEEMEMATEDAVRSGESGWLILPTGDGQESIDFIHEPCGDLVLRNMTVHLDTLNRLIKDHLCSPVKHVQTAENCKAGGPGAPISSGLICEACTPANPPGVTAMTYEKPPWRIGYDSCCPSCRALEETCSEHRVLPRGGRND